MTESYTKAGSLLLALAVLVSSTGSAWAGGETDWKDTAEFSFVAVDGNAESTSFGFKNLLIRQAERSDLTIKAGGIRVETTTFLREAVGGVVVETKISDTTAESYYLDSRYDRKITDSFFWYVGAGWDRNEPAGIKDRYTVEGGLGNIWFETEDRAFKTLYGATFTDETDTSGMSDEFLGARFAWNYMNKLGDHTAYTNELTLDENLDETSDWRADMQNGLTVAMSEKLALKVGLQLIYDNEPAIELIPNDLPSPPNPATLPFPLEELDTLLTVSLVADFK